MKVIFAILLIIILTFWLQYTPPRDYTNLTAYGEPYPDTAIDFSKYINHPEPIKWKLSRKRLTKKEEF